VAGGFGAGVLVGGEETSPLIKGLVVRSNDNGIAVRYDVSIQSILQLNPGINSESILTVGQRLYLPQPTPTPSPEPTSTLPPEEAIVINMSGRGDKDIFTIAHAFGDPSWKAFIRERARMYDKES